MAQWSASLNNWTPTAVADATNFTNSGYMALQGGSTTQRIIVSEIYMGGLAGASSPAQMIVARDSTVGATSLTGVNTAAKDPATAALAAPPVAFTSSTTKPQRSATLQLLLLAFNAFGGVVRWVAPPGGEIGLSGNTASLGELSLSHASTGTPGLMSSHLIYEPL
jgi:hypothetical protein